MRKMMKNEIPTREGLASEAHRIIETSAVRLPKFFENFNRI